MYVRIGLVDFKIIESIGTNFYISAFHNPYLFTLNFILARGNQIFFCVHNIIEFLLIHFIYELSPYNILYYNVCLQKTGYTEKMKLLRIRNIQE